MPRDMSCCRMRGVLARKVSCVFSWAGKTGGPIALRGAPRAGRGDMGFLELPGRESGAFIDRIERDKRA